LIKLCLIRLDSLQKVETTCMTAPQQYENPSVIIHIG